MPKNMLDNFLMNQLNDENYYHFIDCLLREKIYIPCIEQHSEKVLIWKDRTSKEFVPFFSTIDTLKKGCFRAAGLVDVRYIESTAKEFFKKLNGRYAVLNPNLEYTKEFTVEEITWINDCIDSPWMLNFSPKNEMLIYQPINLPLNCFNKLTSIFKKHASVNSAVYSKISLNNEKILEYHLVGLSILNGFSNSFRSIEADLNNFSKELIDFRFVDLNQKNKVVSYLGKQKKFYERA